jgi:hypothetical protein
MALDHTPLHDVAPRASSSLSGRAPRQRIPGPRWPFPRLANLHPDRPHPKHPKHDRCVGRRSARDLKRSRGVPSLRYIDLRVDACTCRATAAIGRPVSRNCTARRRRRWSWSGAPGGRMAHHVLRLPIIPFFLKTVCLRIGLTPKHTRGSGAGPPRVGAPHPSYHRELTRYVEQYVFGMGLSCRQTTPVSGSLAWRPNWFA